MRRIAPLLLLALAACPTTRPPTWEEMTPEQKAAKIKFQKDRLDLYVEFAAMQGQKFVDSGQIKQAELDFAASVARDAVVLWEAYQLAGADATDAQAYELRLKIEEAILKYVAIGIDLALKDTPPPPE